MSDHEPDNQSPHHSQRRPDDLSGVDASRIPAPRSPLDDQPDIAVDSPPQQPPSQSSQPPPQHDGVAWPENGLVEPEFRYDQEWKRGKRRRYNGFVERVGGAEGKQLRENLAAAVRDLLDWAAQHTATPTTRDNNHDNVCDDISDGDRTGCSDGSDGESGTGSSRDGFQTGR